MLTKRDRRRRSIVRHRAIANVRGGLKEKSTLFLIASIALLFLSSLDSTKKVFDIEEDKNNASAITVDEDFIKAIGSTEVNRWLDNPLLLKYRKFSNQRTFIETLAGAAAAESAGPHALLEKEKRDLMKRLKDARAEHEKLSNDQEKQDNQKEINNLTRDLKDTETQIKTTQDNLKSQLDFIHHSVPPRLPPAILTLEKHQKGTLYQILYPLLDDNNNLHVVFQILRVTTLIIIILTFIFFLVMGFQLLPFNSGSATVTEQLKSMISFKPLAAASEIAKVVIIGATAAGIGTAVVLGAQAIDGAGKAVASERSLPSNSRDGGNTYTQVHNSNSNSNPIPTPTPTGFDPWPWAINNQHPIEFSPEIKVPKPLVLDQRTTITEGTDQILGELKTLVKLLPTATKVAALEARIDALPSRQPISTVCNCGEELAEIKKRIDQLETQQQPPGPATAGSDVIINVPKNEPIKVDFGSLATAIGKLQTELEKSNEAERLRQKPDGRNIFNKTTDFIGGAEYFAVTQQSYDVFIKALGSQSFDQKLKDALLAVISLPPQRKSQFLDSLRMRLGPEDSSVALGHLKRFEKKILRYFKLPN